MTKRVGISKKKRFEVFKRDGFSCQYCGAHPPEIILEPDHINPVCNGGDDSMENLITSCFDCNRGKAGNLLTSIPESLASQAEKKKEREAQIKGYRQAIQISLDRIEDDMWQVADALIPDSSVNGFRRDWLRSIKMFNSRLDLHIVLECAEIARAKRLFSDRKLFAYFCGVCWGRIKAV